MKLCEMLLRIHREIPQDDPEVFRTYLLRHCPEFCWSVLESSVDTGEVLTGLLIGLVAVHRYGVPDDVPAWLQGPELNWGDRK